MIDYVSHVIIAKYYSFSYHKFISLLTFYIHLFNIIYMEKVSNLQFEGVKIDSLQALRGIAALFVVCEHIIFLGRGGFGVEIFFLISGFIVMYSTQKKTKAFLGKRFIRIVPLYYIFTILTFIVLILFPQMFADSEASIVNLIKSFLFIPFLQGTYPFKFAMPIMRVGWTINYEIFFYLIFFVSMKISHKLRGVICSAILTVFAIIGLFIPGSVQPWDFWTDCYLLEFVAGIVCFYLFKQIYEKAVRNKIIAVICIVLSIALFGFLWWVSGQDQLMNKPRFIVFGLPCLLIFGMFFYAGCCFRVPKALVKLGDVSYSLFFIHYYPMRILTNRFYMTYYNNEPLSAIQIIAIVVTVCVCIAASFLSHYLIEIKLTEWLKKKLIRA